LLHNGGWQSKIQSYYLLYATLGTVYWLREAGSVLHEICNKSGDGPGDGNEPLGGEVAESLSGRGSCNEEWARIGDGNGAALRHWEAGEDDVNNDDHGSKNIVP
jgi:hypothetical protein